MGIPPSDGPHDPEHVVSHRACSISTNPVCFETKWSALHETSDHWFEWTGSKRPSGHTGLQLRGGLQESLEGLELMVPRIVTCMDGS